ncbi:hpr1 [Anaeramoeba flamelloides]|uniref:Hpr1 n=1 Tax=Anaeramoeba flamelloides TaxID=1746091 RepID=A0ABQ8Z7F3_9EUKA|nr:hpr1 [Anaeramoeba flamelloides]
MKKNFSLLEKGINKLKALIKSDEERRIIYTICNGILIRISKSQTPLFYGSVRMFFTNIFPTSTKLLIEKLKIKNDLINQNNNNNNSHYNNETNSQQKEASTGSTNYKLMNNRKRNYSNNPEKQNQNEIESGSESKSYQNLKKKSRLLKTDYNKKNTNKQILNLLQQKEDKYYNPKKSRVDLELFNSIIEIQNLEYPSLNRESKEINWAKIIKSIELVIHYFEKNKMISLNKKNFEYSFSKYLINENIFSDQLNDLNFRKSILFQLLIFFNSIKLELKKKTDKNHNKTNIDNDHRHRHPLDILFEKNNDFKEKLFTLLKRSERILKNLDNKTYKNIYQILKRNTEWYKWEQKNYFDLRKDLIQENEKDRNFRRIKERNLIRNRSFQNKQTFSTDSYRNKKKEWSFVERWSFNFENFEDLTKKPSSEMFLETIIDEINSPFDIEEELKTKNDPKFSWNALRLLRFHQIDLLKRVDDLEEISKRLLLNNDSKNDINEPQIESHKEDQNKMKKSSEKLIQTNTEIAAEDNNSDNQKKKNVKNEGDEIIIKEELENNMDEINENKMVIEKNLKSKGSISKSDRERNEEEKEIKK